MSVLGRVLFSSGERLDLPDLLAIDSYGAGDWKYFLKGLVGNDPKILKGFDVINPQDCIGTQSLSIRVADSVVFHPSSGAGSFYHGLESTHITAQPLVPELRKNAVNYVYVNFSTFNTSTDTRAFWDVDKDGGAGGEFTQDVNTESVLKVEIGVSVASFPDGSIPICKVTVGPVVITKIENSHNNMFRLGTGGITPDPFYRHNFLNQPVGYSRTETPNSITSALQPNPFLGGDKNIENLKQWMDAVMTKLAELGGSTFWYEDTSTYNAITEFLNANRSFTSKGAWIHSSSTPGLLTWTEDLVINHTSDPRNVIIRAGSANIANNQTMYLETQYDQIINTLDQPVTWTNSSNTVNGSIGSFANLTKGDWIKQRQDVDQRYLRVEEFYANIGLGGGPTTPALARSIKLSANYQGLTGSERAVFSKGVYTSAEMLVADKDSAAFTLLKGNVHWMAHRWDTITNISNITATTVNGVATSSTSSSVRIQATGHGLQEGDSINIPSGVLAGIYTVEVESANRFYIDSAVSVSALAVTGFYAVAITAARSTADGLQLESANHGMETGETAIIAGTSTFDGSWLMVKRSSTVFQFAPPSAPSAVSTGTATLARINARSELGIIKLVQGQSGSIGDNEAANLRTYTGMGGPSDIAPDYVVPGNYNTLDGTSNYNGIVGENLTARIAKLTAMMADKTQDKTIKYAVSENLQTITNTTNGATQEITFNPAGNALIIVTPSSGGQTTVNLPDTAPGIGLLVNQCAYVSIDRNDGGTASIQISNISTLPLDENILVIAVRLSGTAIYIWDGSIYSSGSSPTPLFLQTIIKQNANMKLIEGGTWSAVISAGTPVTPFNHLVNTGGWIDTVSYVGNNIAAWKFTVSNTTDITQMITRLSYATSNAGTITYAVYTNNGSGPGTLIKTATAINVSTLGTTGTGGTPVTFTFPSGTMPAGNYVLVPVKTNPTSDIYHGAYSDAPSIVPQYSSNNNGASWFNGSNNIYMAISGIEGAATAQLTWDAPAYIQIPDLDNSDNSIAAGSVTLDTDEVAYVEVNRTSPGGALTVQFASNPSLVPSINTIIIARYTTAGFVVGNNSMLLIDGESKALYAGTSDQTLTFTGATDNADSTPAYSSTTVITQGTSLTTAIGALDAKLNTASYDESTYFAAVVTAGTSITIPNSNFFVSATAKDVHVIVNGIDREITRDFTVVGAGPTYTQIQFIYDLPLDSVVRFKKQLFV